jgi:hypothetical protein
VRWLTPVAGAAYPALIDEDCFDLPRHLAPLFPQSAASSTGRSDQLPIPKGVADPHSRAYRKQKFSNFAAQVVGQTLGEAHYDASRWDRTERCPRIESGREGDGKAISGVNLIGMPVVPSSAGHDI